MSEEAGEVEETRDRVSLWACALAIGSSGAAMLIWSWGTWLDVTVDFGRELYVPWRLLEGEALYRDIAWFNGPLSQYWNSGVFALFGVGLRQLVLVNVALTALAAVVLFALLARISDRFASCVGCVVFVALFAFNRIDAIGNDSFVTPYSHEVVHGIVLSLIGLWLFSLRRSRPLLAACGSGIVFGLVSLTKAEVLLALAAALAAGWAAELWISRRAESGRGSSVAGTSAAAFLVGAAVPPVLALALLAMAMPLPQALAGALGAWPSILSTDIAEQHFYRATLGTLELGTNLQRLFSFALAQASLVAAIAITGRWLGSRPVHDKTKGAGLLSAGALLVGGCSTLALGGALAIEWTSVLRPLPLLMLLLLAAALGRPPGRSEGPAATEAHVLRIAMIVFAGVLMAKIALRVRLDQYGFALAMPAATLAVVACLHWLPCWVGRRGGDATTSRAAALGALGAVALALLPLIGARIAERTVVVGEGPDAFLSDARAAVVRDTLAVVARELSPGETLAVLPEGVMLNYLTRRANPTGFVNFMPPELIIFGEDRIVAAFESRPPDWIVLAHKDTREYGVDFFGRGYGRELFGWIQRRYRAVAGFGDPPLRQGSSFGTQLLERRERLGSGTDAAASGSARQKPGRGSTANANSSRLNR